MDTVLINRNEELFAAYQEAWALARERKVEARMSRNRGVLDYGAEYELPGWQGKEAAYAWLVGRSSESPMRRLSVAPTPEEIRAELAAAVAAEVAAEAAAPEVAPVPSLKDPLDYDRTHPLYVSGVRSALEKSLAQPHR